MQRIMYRYRYRVDSKNFRFLFVVSLPDETNRQTRARLVGTWQTVWDEARITVSSKTLASGRIDDEERSAKRLTPGSVISDASLRRWRKNFWKSVADSLGRRRPIGF